MAADYAELQAAQRLWGELDRYQQRLDAITLDHPARRAVDDWRWAMGGSFPPEAWLTINALYGAARKGDRATAQKLTLGFMGWLVDRYPTLRLKALFDNLVELPEVPSTDLSEPLPLASPPPPAQATSANQQSEVKALSPCHKKAYSQYADTVRRNPELGSASDRDVYHAVKEQLEAGEKLPSFGTWARYLSECRRQVGTNKRGPRAGRAHGKSVVRRDQI